MTAARDGLPSSGPDGYFGTAFTSAPVARTGWLPQTDEQSDVDDHDRFEHEPDSRSGELENRYEWIVGMMSSFADERLVRIIVAGFTMMMAACAAAEITLGFAASNPIGLGLQIGSAVFALVGGLWWLFATWPRLWALFTFVMLANIAITLATAASDNIPPEIAVGKTAFLVFLGIVAGFFFDRWMLVVHVLYVVSAITGIVGYNVLFRGVPPLGAAVVWIPIVGLAVAIPVTIYLVIRAIRLDQG